MKPQPSVVVLPRRAPVGSLLLHAVLLWLVAMLFAPFVADFLK